MRATRLRRIPSGGRCLRRAVTVATMAAALFAASTARAGVLPHIVNQDESYLTYQMVFDLTAGMGGIHATTPAFPGSDTTSLHGLLYLDVQPNQIAFATGSQISATVNTAPGVGGIPGNYAPFDPVVSDPVGPPPVGATPHANYGLVEPSIDLSAVIYNQVLTLQPGAPMPLFGNQFDLTGQLGVAVDGRQAFVSSLGNDTTNFTEFPFLGDFPGLPFVFGSMAADIGTWAPNSFASRVTIPIHSSLTTIWTTDPYDIYVTYNLVGQIVAHPDIPEPSTMVLAGLGLVGLLGYGYRARSKQTSAR